LAFRGVPDRVAVLAPAVCEMDSQDGQVVHEMVHESLESLSSSEVVILYEYAASSVAEVTAVLETAGASLVLATVMVNDSVPVAPVASATWITTELAPTLASRGVPDNVAVLSPVVCETDSQDGQVVHVMVHESSEESSSVVVMLYEYAASSVPVTVPELVMLGASLTLSTSEAAVSVIVLLSDWSSV
jgi:hypothetical protein